MATLDDTGHDSKIRRLLAPHAGGEHSGGASFALDLDPRLIDHGGEMVTRAELALALNACLFNDLLGRVPTAAKYVAEVAEEGAAIVFDHGALRTIEGPTGALPSGFAAFARILEPLGYEAAAVYPLPRLKMTGRAFVHRDFPETIPQFFVSELHIEQLPKEAQAAASRVFASSKDPLGPEAVEALDRLARDGALPLPDAKVLLKACLAAFQRQHPALSLEDYETLLVHSKEAAWIATEGNAFNHATARVPDVEALARRLKTEGYPMKDRIEVSANGRVRQTAILADKVLRTFHLADGNKVERAGPGSFFEFITRDVDPATGRLDLTFDSGNATGIFAVTRGG